MKQNAHEGGTSVGILLYRAARSGSVPLNCNPWSYRS
jgi:hypothetical protein